MKRRSEEKKNLCSRAIFARVHKGWSLSWGGWYRLLCWAVAPPGISVKDHRAFCWGKQQQKRRGGFSGYLAGSNEQNLQEFWRGLFFIHYLAESVSVSFLKPHYSFLSIRERHLLLSQRWYGEGGWYSLGDKITLSMIACKNLEDSQISTWRNFDFGKWALEDFLPLWKASLDNVSLQRRMTDFYQLHIFWIPSFIKSKINRFIVIWKQHILIE